MTRKARGEHSVPHTWGKDSGPVADMEVRQMDDGRRIKIGETTRLRFSQCYNDRKSESAAETHLVQAMLLDQDFGFGKSTEMTFQSNTGYTEAEQKGWGEPLDQWYEISEHTVPLAGGYEQVSQQSGWNYTMHRITDAAYARANEWMDEQGIRQDDKIKIFAVQAVNDRRTPSSGGNGTRSDIPWALFIATGLSDDKIIKIVSIDKVEEEA